MTLYIMELNTGKTHRRTLKTGSYRFVVETGRKRRFLLVKNYYTGEPVKRVDVTNYGSIRYWGE